MRNPQDTQDSATKPVYGNTGLTGYLGLKSCLLEARPGPADHSFSSVSRKVRD